MGDYARNLWLGAPNAPKNSNNIRIFNHYRHFGCVGHLGALGVYARNFPVGRTPDVPVAPSPYITLSDQYQLGIAAYEYEYVDTLCFNITFTPVSQFGHEGRRTG